MSGRRKNGQTEAGGAKSVIVNDGQVAGSSKSATAASSRQRKEGRTIPTLIANEPGPPGGASDGEEMNDIDIDAIMNEIANEEQDGEVVELDPEVEQMLAELDKTDDYGECVSHVTARTFKSVSQLSVTKEMTDKWKQELKTPENCKEVIVPAVNGPIWGGLSMNARSSDVKMQGLQQYLVRAQVAQMRLMDEMFSSIQKDKMPKLLKPLLDSAKCLSAAMQEINQRRRQQLRPYLKPEFSSMNSSKVAVTGFLYGDDLEKSMKEAKVTANIVKSSTQFAGRQRFHPYKQTQNRFQSLNFNRPSPTMGRGGQQYRSQRPPFQRNRQMFQRQPPTNFQRR